MIIDSGYKCQKCGKVYHKSKSNMPTYCRKCGNTLVSNKYYYNITSSGKETTEANMFGGYDHLKVVLSESVIVVKIRKKWLKWVEFVE